ncbi:MAG: metal-sensitive transcriptional regulator [Acidobacteria bacterium]|nr:MAG: metal-sensitive transcriptional regulator [Acidobacteriota bacterium]REK08887.1 MAG: metal-sensitive transcriptional regulator [Acidobacteriota bacterium]
MHQRQQETRRLVQRLKRAEGQLSGIRRMIEDDQPCVDVLIQIAAVRGALGKVGQLLLGTHVETCVADAMRSGDDSERQQQVTELLQVFERFAGITGR